MLRTISLLLAFFLVFLNGQCFGEMTSYEARNKILMRGICYTNIAFLDAARDGSLEVVKLFLKAGRAADTPGEKRGNGPNWTHWDTALERAAQRGHQQIVDLLLAHGAGKINFPGTNYSSLSTALTSACNRGDVPLVRQLLKLGANPNAPLWVPALSWAAQSGQTEIIQLLIKYEADVNGRSYDGRTPFLYAANSGHTEAMRLLLANGARRSVFFDDGNDALMTTASHGYLEPTRFLLDQGWDIHTRNKQGDTALLLAVTGGHLDVARLLLEHGAVVDVCNEAGKDPLHAAFVTGNQELIALIKEKSGPLEPGLALLDAIMLGNHAQAAALLQNQTNPNYIIEADLGGPSAPPMVLAARKDDLKMVRLLLDAGADPNAIYPVSGETPLQVAATKGNEALALLLLERGAVVDKLAERVDESEFFLFYRTPLYLAAQNGHLKLVQLLLNHGANINAMAYDDVEGNRGTPLMAATEEKQTPIVQELLTRGAELNHTSYQGVTALTIARLGKYNELYKILKTHGAKEFPEELKPWGLWP